MARRKKAAPPKPAEVDAVLSPDGRQICPRCFSRPDFKGRADWMVFSSERGSPWEVKLTDESVQVNGDTLQVGSLRYPCSNAACFTVITTRFALGIIGREAIGPVTPRLSAKDVARYELGVTGRDGVWRGPGAPDPSAAPVLPAEPEKQKKRASRRAARAA